MGFGRYYEEFEVGEIIKHWPGRTITEFDDSWFALMTMNQHPVHLDANYAEKHTQHKQRLVVGTLVFSLAVGISVSDISGRAIANLDYENITHDSPTFHGDTIYAETEVLKARESSKGDRGIIYVETRVTNQRDELVMTFKRNVLVPKKNHATLGEGKIP